MPSCAVRRRVGPWLVGPGGVGAGGLAPGGSGVRVGRAKVDPRRVGPGGVGPDRSEQIGPVPACKGQDQHFSRCTFGFSVPKGVIKLTK